MTTETAPPHPRTALPYHRLTRLEHRTSRWWRPPATVAVACAVFAVLSLLGIMALALASLFVPWLPEPSDLGGLALDNPTDMLLTFGILALMIPAVLLGARWGGGRSRILHSVAGRLRLPMMLRAGAVLTALYTAVCWGVFLLDPPDDAAVPQADPMLLIGLLVCLVLVPSQCAAEEYVFRGLPQQFLGTWSRSPLWGIVLPVPLFMLGHGYGWAGQVDIAVFALCMGFLVWKTGGAGTRDRRPHGEQPGLDHRGSVQPFVSGPGRGGPRSPPGVGAAHARVHRGPERVVLPHPRSAAPGTAPGYRCPVSRPRPGGWRRHGPCGESAGGAACPRSEPFRHG